MPIDKDVLVPCTIRENISLPMLSHPKMCSAQGFNNLASPFNLIP